MNKLFKLAQSKGKCHKFPYFSLEGGAKLYKNFAQKLLAVSLCMAVVLLGTPLGGGGHVSEAAEEEGTVLNIVLTEDDSSDDLSVSVDWSSFDLSVPPSLALSSSSALLADEVLYIFAGDQTNLSTPLVFAHRASAESPWSYSDLLFTDGPSEGEVEFACIPRCVGCWSSYTLIPGIDTTGDPLPATTVPPLPGSLLFRSSVALPSSVGSSSSWKPDVKVAHCKACAVTLVAPADSPVTVSGAYGDGWTITRSAPGEAVLDLKVGDFKVGEVTVTEAANPTPPVDRSSWGTPYVREADGVTQYVVEDPASPDYGMTSVELDPELASAHDATSLTYWVRESSGSTSAWYGLTAHISTCHPGYRFYVQWLSPGDPGYDALLAQLDDAAKQRIEDDNGWIFNMGIRDPDGNDLHYITAPNGFSTQPVVYVQIGDDWDADDLNAYYIAAGGDENVPVDYLMLDYPAGTDTFGRMTLEHFSPYIIFDELTDAEKATLGKSNPTTGDHAAQMAISGLGMVLVLALGIMLRLITGKKKFSE